MDMKKSTVQVVVQAEALRKEAGSDKMYVEYIFYGLLKVASYLEDPSQGKEYRGEAEELRLYLEEKMRSVSSARMKLREEALNGSKGFDDTPAAVLVGRAAEIAGGNQFSPIDLAKAILEKPTAVIQEVCRVKTAAGAAEDTKYDPGATVMDGGVTVSDDSGATVPDPALLQRQEAERKAKEEEERRKAEERRRREEERKRKAAEQKAKEEAERKAAEKKAKEEAERQAAEKKAKEEADRKRREQEQQKQNDDSGAGTGLTNSELRALLEQLPNGNKGKANKPSKPSKPGKPQKPAHNPFQQRRRKTKIGLFTFRGGMGAALFQYLLLALILPLIAVAAVEFFTGGIGKGAVTSTLKDPSQITEWAAFGVRALLIFWAWWVFRAICNFISQWSKSFCLFLRTLGDIAVIAWLTVSVKSCFSMHGGIYPSWIRYVSGVLGILVLCFAAAMYDFLKYTDYQKRRSIKFVTTEGVVPKVMFQKLTRLLIFPCALLMSLWIQTQTADFPGTFLAGLPLPQLGLPLAEGENLIRYAPMQLWQTKVVWICLFIFAWNVPNYILTCLKLGAEASWYRGGGEGIAKFFYTFYTMMFVPALVFFLHWLFSWNPMQLWVLIVLGVYTLFSLIMGIVSAKQ